MALAQQLRAEEQQREARAQQARAQARAQQRKLEEQRKARAQQVPARHGHATPVYCSCQLSARKQYLAFRAIFAPAQKQSHIDSVGRP